MVKAGEKSQNNIRQAVMDMLNSDPALSIDYVELKDAEDLKDISEVSRKAVLALAVRVGRARLIDNTVLDPAR
jgi:pantoate--beta-alanine ligase